MPERTYKKQLESSRHNMSPEQVSKDKNARCHIRNLARKEANIAKMKALQAHNAYLTPQERLAALPKEGAKRERAKFMALIAKQKEVTEEQRQEKKKKSKEEVKS